METHETSHSESFAEIINKYRHPGESNAGFGRRMGLNHKIFRDWEKGQVPKVDTLIKIREFLGLSKNQYDELFFAVYKFIPQEVTINKNTGKQEKRNKINYAHNLPSNYFLKRFIAFKDAQETEREFARRIGITDREWLEMMAKPTIPQSITVPRLLKMIKILDPRGKRNLASLLSDE